MKLLLLLDGFDWSYLKIMPNFLKILKKSQYAKIKSSPLFTEAITFWKGDYPKKHNFFSSIFWKKTIFGWKLSRKKEEKTFLYRIPLIKVYHVKHFDTYGHYNRKRLKEYLKHWNKKILDLINEYEEIVIVSDHGMKKVKKKINIYDELEKIDGIEKYLVGATVVYIWTKKGKKEKVKKQIEKTKKGFVINTLDYNLPKTKCLFFVSRYREVFVPNFFEENLEGAHGWIKPTYSPFIYYKENIKPKFLGTYNIIDLAPTIVKIFGGRYECDGKAFI